MLGLISELDSISNALITEIVNCMYLRFETALSDFKCPELAVAVLCHITVGQMAVKLTDTVKYFSKLVAALCNRFADFAINKLGENSRCKAIATHILHFSVEIYKADLVQLFLNYILIFFNGKEV